MICAKVTMPMPAPMPTKSRLTTSRLLTALSTYSYLPSSTRINAPEMPGRIMAQMASAPLRNKNQ